MRNARSVRTGDAPRAAGATIGRVGPFLEAAACQPRSYAAGAAGRRRRTRGRDAAGLLELAGPGRTRRRATKRHGPTRRKPSSQAPRPRRNKRRGKGQGTTPRMPRGRRARPHRVRRRLARRRNQSLRPGPSWRSRVRGGRWSKRRRRARARSWPTGAWRRWRRRSA